MVSANKPSHWIKKQIGHASLAQFTWVVTWISTLMGNVARHHSVIRSPHGDQKTKFLPRNFIFPGFKLFTCRRIFNLYRLPAGIHCLKLCLYRALSFFASNTTVQYMTNFLSSFNGRAKMLFQ